MAGVKRPRCSICKEFLDPEDEDVVKYKTGFAHRKCFNIAISVAVRGKKEDLIEARDAKKSKTDKPKPQKELKLGLSEEEYADKRKLCDYIRDITKEDVSVATYALIEDYKKKYQISYKEMYADLYWYFGLCNHDVVGDMIIAVVPRCHTEAQKYYKSIERSNASCQENLKNLPQMYQEKSAAVSSANERRTTKPQIDIAAIGGDE